MSGLPPFDPPELLDEELEDEEDALELDELLLLPPDEVEVLMPPVELLVDEMTTLPPPLPPPPPPKKPPTKPPPPKPPLPPMTIGTAPPPPDIIGISAGAIAIGAGRGMGAPWLVTVTTEGAQAVTVLIVRRLTVRTA